MARGGKQKGGRKTDETKRTLTVDVERYLKGIDMPASKEELIDQAKENDAPGDILKALDMLEDKAYQSVVDISKDVTKYR